MAIIEVRGLTFSYDDKTNAVDDISFDIEEGSYTTIVGHNGSGKSTCAKLITGLLEKKSGDIKVNGLELNEENLYKIRAQIGIVFQNPDNQFIGSTVRDDIAFGLENHCIPQEDMDGLIDKYAEKVGMTKYLEHEPSMLSGGQKQRVAIAGVLAMQPKIIFFDEATSMLDPQGKAEIKRVIMDLHKETGLTIVSITHDIDEVISSDHVIALYEGHIASTGTPEEFFGDEKKLTQIKLDLPFSVKMEHALKKRGVKTDDSLSMEGLVENLCRLHSKK